MYVICHTYTMNVLVHVAPTYTCMYTIQNLLANTLSGMLLCILT